MRKMDSQILLSIGIAASFILGQFFLEQESLFSFMIMSMVVIGILSMMVRTIYGFALLIAYILFIAFYNVGFSWIMHIDVVQQGFNIKNQAILSFAAIMAWFCGYSVQKNNQELQLLREEVETLRKVESNTGILTINEFKEQGQLLFTGMKRRKEQGFLVQVYLDRVLVDYKARILYEKVSKSILKTIRAKYDLACQINSRAILLYLNNTSEQGVEVALKRIHQNLENEGIVPAQLAYEVVPVKEDWELTLLVIDSLMKGEKSA